MAFCIHCGAEIPDNTDFCIMCGKQQFAPMSKGGAAAAAVTTEPVQPSQNSSSQPSIDFTATKDAFMKKAKETYSKARDEVSQVVTETKKRTAGSANSKVLSDEELWSWLKISEKRTAFFQEDNTEIDTSVYMQKLGEKLEDNRVPVDIAQRTVTWDQSGVQNTYYVLQPRTGITNPITLLLQVNTVGDFTFVETKEYMTPPELPKPRSAFWRFLLTILPFLRLLFTGWERRWNEAWDKWERTVFGYYFQEDINGALSRIYDAALYTVNQLNEELFKDAKTETKEDNKSMTDLQDIVAKRKADIR